MNPVFQVLVFGLEPVVLLSSCLLEEGRPSLEGSDRAVFINAQHPFRNVRLQRALSRPGMLDSSGADHLIECCFEIVVMFVALVLIVSPLVFLVSAREGGSIHI